MREGDYSRGKRLCALVASFMTGTTMATALKYLDPNGPENESWERLAGDLVRSMSGQRQELFKRLRPKDKEVRR